MVILRGNDITLRWTITKCLDGSEVPEDFSGADLSVFILSYYDRVRFNALVEGNVITVSIPGNTQKNGKIGIEAVWSKNNGKNWSRAKQVDVLEITDDPKRVTHCSGATVDNHVVELANKLVGSVGYDGITPEIINGNWWIGSVDTGISVTGPQGDAFTFEDFTSEQIDMLKQPAVDAAKEVAKLESTISLNEQVRIQAEQNRAQAERNRLLAEQGRVDNESTRVSNEESRTQSETIRHEAEIDRSSAEQLRTQGEEKRIAEEQKRINAEQSRETAEHSRVTTAEKAVKECETSATHATEHGDYAKEQGDYAKEQSGSIADCTRNIGGLPPMIGSILKINVGVWDKCSQAYKQPCVDESTGNIYCCVYGNSDTGGICKINNGKITAYLSMDHNSRSDQTMVIIDGFLYCVGFGWLNTDFIWKVDLANFNLILKVKNDGISTRTSSLFKIGDRLFLHGGDKKLYEVDKDTLSLSVSIFENCQYILQQDNNTLIVADDKTIFRYKGSERLNSSNIPSGFEIISQLILTNNTELILLRSGVKVRSYCVNGSISGGGLITIEKDEPIYDLKKMYSRNTNWDDNYFMQSSGYTYYSYGGSATLNLKIKQFNGVSCNYGAYLYGNTILIPTNGGFLYNKI